MKFKLIGGMHVDKNGRHKKGAIIESDVNLCKTIANKFERWDGTEEEAEAEVVEAEAEGVEAEDVSNAFPRAANNGLVVTKMPDGTLSVFDKGDLNDPLNDQPLNKAGVNKLVKEFTS